jgi:hypothetical protein
MPACPLCNKRQHHNDTQPTERNDLPQHHDKAFLKLKKFPTVIVVQES